MIKPIRTLSLILLSMIIGSIGIAQDLPLAGRSSIELSLGFWTGGASASATVGTAGVRSEAGTNGFSGGLAYAYWLQENLTLTFSGGLRSAEANSTVNLTSVVNRSSAVIPVLLGVRYYFLNPEPVDNIRPFVSLAVGPYFGAEASSTLLAQQSHVETAIGGRPGIGVDFRLGNHFKLGADVGYHVTADFRTEVGGRKSYNGGEFCFVLGYIF